MPSLSDRLKALGVRVGMQDLKPSRPARYADLDATLGGASLMTHFGETYVVHNKYEPGYKHGWHTFPITYPSQGLAFWARTPLINELPIEAYLFLDTETTGLSGGTGTYAFLIGVGRFIGDTFQVSQFFMQEPSQEQAQLAALDEFIAGSQAIVTYNGKSFDIPLLATRFHSHGLQAPFKTLLHLDLLHLARRIWRERLPSRTLSNLEVQILGVNRTDEDIPGWMIPQIFFDYLRSGDPSQLRNIFYHNRLDVISLAALLQHMAWLLAEPQSVITPNELDLIAVARLYEDYGEYNTALRLYLDALHTELPEPILADACMHLGLIHKREQKYAEAIEYWQKAAQFQHINAYIELAKVYEHRLNDYAQALHWTTAAISILDSTIINLFERQHYLDELNHRLNRLERKHT